MQITATHINYYHICRRKLWLFGNGINMEHTSDTVYDGKLLHETSYPQRAEKYTEIELSAIFTPHSSSLKPHSSPLTPVYLSGKVDFYDAREKVIHETKRSDKMEEAHEWQVKFYIWLLELNDVTGAHGVLEYPKLRQTNEVWLSEPDRVYLQEAVHKIEALQQDDVCPPRIDSRICKSCSYYELCYVGE